MLEIDFPIPKLDFISTVIPFNANENVGITSLNENNLFDYDNSDYYYYRRFKTIIHETTHAVFGYLISLKNLESMFTVEGFTEYYT